MSIHGARLSLTLRGPTGSRLRRTAVSRKDGGISVHGLPDAERYSGWLTFPGYKATTVSVDAAALEGSTPLQFALVPGATVRGRVVDAEGRPMPDLSIWSDRRGRNRLVRRDVRIRD